MGDGGSFLKEYDPKKFRQISTPTSTRTIVLPVSAGRGSPAGRLVRNPTPVCLAHSFAPNLCSFVYSNVCSKRTSVRSYMCLDRRLALGWFRCGGCVPGPQVPSSASIPDSEGTETAWENFVPLQATSRVVL